MDYRHIIDLLVRKPGAFENYRYREELFPTSRFRMAFDELKGQLGARGSKEYLAILELAAKESEAEVDEALRVLLEKGESSAPTITAATVSGSPTQPEQTTTGGPDIAQTRCCSESPKVPLHVRPFREPCSTGSASVGSP